MSELLTMEDIPRLIPGTKLVVKVSGMLTEGDRYMVISNDNFTTNSNKQYLRVNRIDKSGKVRNIGITMRLGVKYCAIYGQSVDDSFLSDLYRERS